MNVTTLPAPIVRLDGETVYERKNLRVTVDQIRHPDGSPGEYTLVDLGSRFSAFIIPVARVNGVDMIAMVRQHRYPINEWILELPAGGVDSPEAGEAMRELHEETGMVPEDIELIGTFYELPGSSRILASAWLARVPATALELDHVEGESGCVTEWYTVPELQTLMADGGIRSGITLAVLGLGFAAGKLRL